MGLVGYKVGSELRTRWRTWLAVALLAALAGGAITAAVAGAHRAETAYGRFLRDTRAFDVLFTNGTTPESLNQVFDRDELAALDGVDEMATVGYYFASGTTPAGRELADQDLSPLAPVEGGFGTTLNRAVVREGRMVRDLDEVAVSVLFAERFNVGVGDRLELSLSAPTAPFVPTPPAEPYEVVGVVALQSGIPPLTGGLPPVILLSDDFAPAHPGYAELFAVRLSDGAAGASRFNAKLQELAGDEQLVTATFEDFATTVERSITVQVGALRILATLLALGGALIVGQATARVLRADADRSRPLLALGADQRHLFRMALARAALIATTAAVGTAAVAIALSPLLPIGTARPIEPDRGLDIDARTVVPAAVLVGLALLALGAVVGRARPVGGDMRAGRGSALIGATAAAGAPTAVVTGLGLTLDRRRDRPAAPALTALVHTSIAVATITGVVVFSSSLRHLFDDPEQYGWAWDVQVGDSFADDLSPEIERIAADPGTAALAAGTTVRVDVEGYPIDVLAVDPVQGDLTPVIVAGRAPTAPDEIALGGRTLATIDASMGDRVRIDAGDESTTATVVGQTVLTEFGGAARLGEGATMTFEGARRLSPVERDLMLVRLRPGADGETLRKYLSSQSFGNVYLPEEPSDLAELQRVGGFPSVCAILIAATATLALIHALLTSVRERRGDLAILKVLGFDRRQIRLAVATQAGLIATAALVIGTVLGIPAGAEAWKRFATHIGVPTAATTSVTLFALVAGLVAIGTALAALLPAHSAAHTSAASTLRQA